MAATADPGPKLSSPAAPRHMKMKPSPPPPRAHRVPSSLSAVSGGGTARDRRRSSSTSHRRGGADKGPRDGRLEDLRTKLMGRLRDAADRLRLPPPPEPEPRSPEPQLEPPAAPLSSQPEATAASRPWNLRGRKRRPTARGAAALGVSLAEEKARRNGGGDGDVDRAPFAVSLTAEEVEEDIYALTGARPRRRPRKRPRVVQRHLDSLFPGLWLTEITADVYKVPDD